MTRLWSARMTSVALGASAFRIGFMSRAMQAACRIAGSGAADAARDAAGAGAVSARLAVAILAFAVAVRTNVFAGARRAGTGLVSGPHLEVRSHALVGHLRLLT